MFFRAFVSLVAAGAVMTVSAQPVMAQDNPVVVLETSMGNITIELFPEQAPISVENFLGYVDAEHYDGTIFHRVIPDFMVQGGRFLPSMQGKQTGDPIKNEAENGLKNDEYTVAMARTSDPNSATSQFFINHVDNDFLDYASASNPGYAVFGEVIDGMDVVDAIGHSATESKQGLQNVPVAPIIILEARIIEE